MRNATQRLAAAVLILAALSGAGCAQNMAYAPIPPNQTESQGSGSGGY